ncbi:MAG: hypothetical protein ACLFMZ_04775 [Spirochaetaceae bacterium]
MAEVQGRKEELQGRLKENLSEETFAKIFPEGTGLDARGIFNRTSSAFVEEELPEVLAEIILTVTAECGRDDFHSWNYDHLEHIIELSNEFNFSIPKNLLNGLPEQLIILVDSGKVDRDGECT